MKKLVAAVVGILLGAAGCEQSPELVPAPSPALWQATGPNGERAWLFGTIHALPDGTMWRTGLIDEVMEETDLLMVEIDNLDHTADARAAFQARAFSTGLPPLLTRMPAEKRAGLAELLDRAGRSEDSFATTESWAVALQLGNAVRCANPSNGVDRALLDRIESAQSLESFQQQFDIFDRLSDDAQSALLVSLQDETDCSEGENRTRAWLEGDLDYLSRTLEQGFQGNAELRKALLLDRNQWYVERLVQFQKLSPETDVLVAVGAGHMLGEDGVPALLAQRGYTVERIQ